MPVDVLLRPKSIAVLGASARPSIGQAILSSLGTLRYRGDIFPVNPKYDEVLGHRCHGSLDELPAAPDVVAFCVGSGRIAENMEAAARIGAKGAVIYGSGFDESGEEGKALQARISGLCAEAGIALCGPNCMGVLNPHEASSIYLQEICNPSRLAGNVGLVSQSGSVCIAMLSDLRRFGFSHVISSGNEAVLIMADYLEALVDDPQTRVIGLFVESVRDPERFVAALDRAADKGKPVVVLKVGKTERTARAITSHTGGLAGSSRVFSAILEAHRAIEVSDMDEFTEVLAVCQGSVWPSGRRIAVVTASGGQAELILDVAAESGYDLPPLRDETRREIERVTGPLTGDGNPVDAWGNGDWGVNLPHAIASLQADGGYDAIAICSDAGDGQPMSRPENALLAPGWIAQAAAASDKPHYLMGTRPGVMMGAQADFARDHGLACIGGSRQGLGAVDRLARWSHIPPARRGERKLAGGLAGVAGLASRKSVNEAESKAVLAVQGLPVTREFVVTDLAGARRAAVEIGYPVVLKAVSDDIAHKSDLGLVMVGIRDEDALEQSFAEMERRIEKAGAHGRVLGILVQEMVTGGVEVFAGVNRDPDFGLVLAFGLGGVAIEILRDVSLRVLPLREGDAAAMVREIKGYPLLTGARGAAPCDVAALVECLEAFADYAWADRARIAEIDLNPIKILEAGRGCRIVDALIVPKT